MTPEELLAVYNEMDDTLEYREAFKRVPFSYPGNKSTSLEHILPCLPYYNTFVDVFGGSGVVTLNRRPSRLDVYNDRASGVTCFFRVVRDPKLLDKLVERISLSVHGREEFMWSRDSWGNQTDDVERAARWYICVQSSFAGRGLFFGRVVKGNGRMWAKIQENLSLFHDIAVRFRTMQIENADWRHLLKDYDTFDTVFYLDPPYWGHNIYTDHMSKSEHTEMCERIFKCKGFVALSGYNTEVYKKYPWDVIKNWKVSDMMTTAAITTETSLVHGDELVTREEQEEWLYIKERE